MDFFFRGFWWICVAEGVGEVSGVFEGEGCVFPGSEGIVRIVWVGSVGGGLVRFKLVGRVGGGDRDVRGC